MVLERKNCELEARWEVEEGAELEAWMNSSTGKALDSVPPCNPH